MRDLLRALAIVWLVLGAIVFAHGAMTGSGPAGALLYRQLIATHSVSPMIVSELLFFPLCLIPLVMLIATRDRTPPRPQTAIAQRAGPRRALLLGGLLGGTIALLLHPGRNVGVRLAALVTLSAGAVCLSIAAWNFLEHGNPLYDMPPINLNADQAIPPVREARITGIVHPQIALAYEETSEVRGSSYGRHHRLTPFTQENWTEGRPVRVLLDMELPADLPDGRRVTRRGFVSPGVPDYVRRAFSDRHVMLDNDVVVLSTAPETKNASILLAIGVIALAMGFALAAANKAAGTPPAVH
jgi:hypothetical protein